MTPRELLVQLREKGVEIKSNGDRLVIDAPKGAITPDLRDALAANKAELLKILNTPAPGEKSATATVEKPVAPKPIAPPAAQAPSSGVQPVAPATPPPPPLAAPPAAAAAPKVETPAAASTVAEEIKQLEAELTRLRSEEDARRAEFETARLAG
jgi:hypothetical protein